MWVGPVRSGSSALAWCGVPKLFSTRATSASICTGPANRTYGFANYYLNALNERGQRALPNAPETAFYHLGAGSNIVYVDPANDLVIVTRWINNNRALDAMVKVLTTK